MKIRAIVVDDEFLARQRLIKLLEQDETIQVIADCKNGKLAIEAIENKDPDLIFLDVQMPDMDGFEVLNRLPKPLPEVIFTTAYDQYALKAFDVHAIDYLLKPFDEDRLFEAIDQLKKRLNLQKSANFEAKLMELVKSYHADTSDFQESFVFKEKGKEYTLFVDDVNYFSAQGNYVSFNTKERKSLYRISMSNLESLLDPSRFLRIHRTLIVNLKSVDKHTYQGNNEYEFLLKTGEKISSGRSYKDLIDQQLV